MQAATAAACLAARTGATLHLVHALDLPPDALKAQSGHPLLLWAEGQLAREGERLRGLGASVTGRAVAGQAERVLQAAARDLKATLVVVGALGQGGNDWHRLGSRADRTAQHSHVPVLTIRDAAPFVSWLREGRALRVVLGADTSESTENAARWLDSLCLLGPVDLTLAHFYWPPEAFGRFGIEGNRSLVEPNPEVVGALGRDLSQRLDHLLHAKLRAYRIEPYLGRPGDALAALAQEMPADLVIVGSRAIGALEKLWDGSVARQTLQAARVSVACVPAPSVPRKLHVPRLRHVLVATDFSDLANSAIPLAYSTLQRGGTIHLLHVLASDRPRIDPYDVFRPVPDEVTTEAAAAARSRLSQLIPPDASGTGIVTELHVIDAADAWQAICQAAERLGADLICLGTHGRGGIARAALGSVAANVLTHTRRPLLLARGQKP
jgi:nucleotide-binding universal stress UspA family protein